MAKQVVDTIQQYNNIKNNILEGKFSPFYLLMGEEPYYVDALSDIILEKALMPSERDFNQTILYGSDTNADEIASICSRFPMMAERQLVIIKEAQTLKKLDSLTLYLEHILESTILVLCFTGKNADKRTGFYKTAQKKGIIFESAKIKEEAIPRWIESHVKSLGKEIEHDAAMMLAEYAGTELRKLVLELDKLFKVISETNPRITPLDIENNIGISREFNIMELTRALSIKDGNKTFKIAYYFGESPKKYPIQMTLGFLFYFFSKVELVHAHLGTSPKPTIDEAVTRAGLYYRYATSYVSSVKSYPLIRTMKIISLIRECDYKCKSNARGNSTDGELLVDLLGKILSL